jgi:Family of unknown function (DUF6188)
MASVTFRPASVQVPDREVHRQCGAWVVTLHARHDGEMTTEDAPADARAAGLSAAPSSEAALVATALAQPLVGQSLVQLRLGAGDAQLHFTGHFTITFESPLVVVGPAPDGPVVPYALDGVALLLPLLNADVELVGVSDDGALSVTVGGTTLRCGMDPDFEAWNYTGPGGRLVVSVPGGRLAIWDAM